jgi:hypothetical protein
LGKLLVRRFAFGEPNNVLSFEASDGADFELTISTFRVHHSVERHPMEIKEIGDLSDSHHFVIVISPMCSRVVSARAVERKMIFPRPADPSGINHPPQAMLETMWNKPKPWETEAVESRRPAKYPNGRVFRRGDQLPHHFPDERSMLTDRPQAAYRHTHRAHPSARRIRIRARGARQAD